MRMIDGPVTAADLLFAGSGADPSAGLALDVAPSLDAVLPGALGAAVRRTVSRDVAQAAEGLTHLDVGDLFAAGWQKHSQLRAAGRRTREAPGTRETVVLAEHHVSHEAHPYVDVMMGGARLTRVAMTVRVDSDRGRCAIS